jgi:hypothetical protein
MQARGTAVQKIAQLLHTLDPRLGSLGRRPACDAIPNSVRLTAPPAHGAAVVQLKKASASIACRTDEKTPFAAIPKFTMLDLDFALQNAFALAKSKDNLLRVASHDARGA